MKKYAVFIVFTLTVKIVFAQNDSLVKENRHMILAILDSLSKIHVQLGTIGNDPTFTGTSLIPIDERKIEEPQLVISGYVSAYYAHYSDSVGFGNFQKFPTSAPRSDAFSLNILQLSMKYSSHSARATATLHYGDMPASVWSPVYNYIQEANAGIRLFKKWWIDAGFFRTHIGLESVQPRENITTNIAVVTFNEPYFLSGAKLSFLAGDKLILQVNAFNAYNGYIETNRKKAFGFSCLYDLNSKISMTFNTLYSDDTPDTNKIAHGRLYNNFYMTYRASRIVLGFEANYAMQQNTSLAGLSNQTAQLFSSLLAVKYKLHKRWYGYGKLEYYYDPEEMLSGPVLDNRHLYVDLEIGGATLGIEYKPFSNGYLRLESRVLATTDNEQIFKMDGHYSSTRYEIISELGAWF